MADEPERVLSREDILNAPAADPNDPAEIATRAKWAEENRTFVQSLTAQCMQVGRQLADNGKADFSLLPLGVQYDVTDGKEGLRGDDKAAGVIFVLSSIVRSEYKKRLAVRYLEDTGLAPGVAALANTMDSPAGGDLLDLQRLTKEERLAFRKALDTLERLQSLVIETKGTPLSEKLDPPATAEEKEAAAAILKRSTSKDAHLEMPGAKAAAAIVEALQAKAVLPVEHYAQERAKLLTNDSGKQQPTPREWLTARGQESALEALGFGLERLAREDSERQLEETKRQLAEERERRKQRPALRQSTGWLRAIMQREDHVTTTRKRERVAGRLTAEESAARKLFKYEPLGWAERLAIHGLATIARDAGLLDAHPWALASRPLAGMEPARVAIAFPGITELARVAGFEPGANRKIAGEHRQTMERALKSLVNVPRWIAQPVLVRVGKKLVKDTEVTQTLWVEARGTILTRKAELLLHPVAFASHLVSFVTMGNLAARYEAARRAIGQPQMRDEWVICDDYCRYLSTVKAFDKRVKGERQDPGEENPERMVTAGEVTFNASVSDATLRAQLGITHLARDRGESKARQRVESALSFAQAMGTLQAFALEQGNEGPVWRLELTNPDIGDGSQGLLLLDEVAGL
jgi:hypothetical protein